MVLRWIMLLVATTGSTLEPLLVPLLEHVLARVGFWMDLEGSILSEPKNTSVPNGNEHTDALRTFTSDFIV